MLQPYFQSSTGDSIEIAQLRFYISGIALLDAHRVVWEEPASYHLMDAEFDSSMQVSLDIPAALPFSHILFHLGIDSTTNVAGALGGDLDPTRGMYWTWQSGYINLKLEGKSKLCKARNQAFQFHLGGYAAPYNTLQTFVFATSNAGKTEVEWDIQQLLLLAGLPAEDRIMSPGIKAHALSEQLHSVIHLIEQ